MNCSNKFMAKKMNTLRFVPQVRGGPEGAHRRTAPPLPTLYFNFMEPRKQAATVYPPKRRLQITVDAENRDEVPQPIKITYAD
jgi:hypothetical protein